MKKIVTFGELLMRFSTENNQRFSQATHYKQDFGGAEGNVAASLSILGTPTTFVTRLPNNDIGIAAKASVAKYGVNVDEIVFGGNRIGLYFVEVGAAQRGGKVIYDRRPSSFSESIPSEYDWDKIFENTTHFHWSGITPALSLELVECLTDALKKAKEKGITISTDLNFRELLWQKTGVPISVMRNLTEYCTTIIGGFPHFASLFDIRSDKKDDMEYYADLSEQVSQQFPNMTSIVFNIRNTKSAQHHEIGAYGWENNTVYKSRFYDITHIVDRIGGGDAFAAGFLHQFISNKQNMQNSLDFGISAACLKHSIPGDINITTTEEVNQLLKGDGTGRITR